MRTLAPHRPLVGRWEIKGLIQMPENTASEDLENLRAILIGPFEEHLRMRDEKILEVVSQMQTTMFERVAKLEEIVTKLPESMDQDRHRTVIEIGDAMAQLGQQLRTFGVDPDAETPSADAPAEDFENQQMDETAALIAQVVG
jgi:hypothetical protein